jgi:hypothetical protein
MQMRLTVLILVCHCNEKEARKEVLRSKESRGDERDSMNSQGVLDVVERFINASALAV